MDKYGMRNWIASLEEVIDLKLAKWRKKLKIENGEAVQLGWQWEQTRIILNVFWHDGSEGVNLHVCGPRSCHDFHWSGLSDKTFNRVMDRVGNLAQTVMCPPIEPES